MKRSGLGLLAAGLMALAGLAATPPALARGNGMIFFPPMMHGGGWPGNGGWAGGRPGAWPNGRPGVGNHWNRPPGGWNGHQPWNPNWYQNGYWHGPRYPYRYPGYNWYYRGFWYPWPWWGNAWNAEIGENYGYYGGLPRAGLSRRHVAWCTNRYRSYNPRTDSYTGYDGRQHRCKAPY